MEVNNFKNKLDKISLKLGFYKKLISDFIDDKHSLVAF